MSSLWSSNQDIEKKNRPLIFKIKKNKEYIYLD